MEKNTNILKELMRNVSNDGFLEQMLRDEFAEKVYKDNDLIKYILEDLKVNRKKRILLKKYRENIEIDSQDYSYEKSLILKYLQDSTRSFEVLDVLEEIPNNVIIDDQDFVEKILKFSSIDLLHRKPELISNLRKYDWYIEMIIENKSINLKNWSNFDFSKMERNLRIIEADPKNYEYFNILDKVNTMVLDCVFNRLEKIKGVTMVSQTHKWTILQNIADTIEIFDSNRNNNYYLEKDLPLNSQTVTPENYKNLFIDAGIYYKRINYLDSENAKVIKVRAEKLNDFWKITNHNNTDGAVEILLDAKSLIDKNCNIESTYELITNYEQILKNNEKYKVTQLDIKLIKSLLTKCSQKNEIFKNGLKDIKNKGYELEYIKNSKDIKQDVLSNLEQIQPILLQGIISVKAPVNKNVKSKTLKF